MGSHTAKTKAQRLNIRVTEEEKRLVEQAADLMHMTTSQFVMQAAVRTAQEALVERTRFVLPAERWAEFAERLDRPAREIPALKRALSKRSPVVES